MHTQVPPLAHNETSLDPTNAVLFSTLSHAAYDYRCCTRVGGKPCLVLRLCVCCTLLIYRYVLYGESEQAEVDSLTNGM